MGVLNEIYYSIETSIAKTIHGIKAYKRRETRIDFGPERNQRAIIYEPEEVLHEEIVFYFHGGAYLIGTPESMGIAADCFCAKGYRLVSVGFRHMPKYPFPKQIEDAFTGTARAIEYLSARDIDTQRLVMAGNSAGGHAAAMIAYDKDRCAAYGIDPQKICGMISVAGAIDASAFNSKESRFISLSEGETMNDYSPIELLSADTDVPILCLNGRYDTVIPHDVEHMLLLVILVHFRLSGHKVYHEFLGVVVIQKR